MVQIQFSGLQIQHAVQPTRENFDFPDTGGTLSNHKHSREVKQSISKQIFNVTILNDHNF